MGIACCWQTILMKLQSKKEGKDQESIQSSTKPDAGYQWESDNFTIRHHKREPIGNHKIVIEYDQERPQSQTADKPMSPRGRATQQSRDTRKINRILQETMEQ